jgi:hypothetical protein
MAELFAPVERIVQLNYYITQQWHNNNKLLLKYLSIVV